MKIPEILVIETIHKPGSLAKVLQVIADGGLTIEHLGEHAVDESLAARWPRAERYLGWPMLLLIKLARRAG